MKKNLSEELAINDDISLGVGEEEQAKENEKVFEDHEKEVNKDLADKVDDVEEINEFEAKPIEIKDGEDKKVKIKGLTEKLVLEEPSDILTEDVNHDYDAYFNAVTEMSDVVEELFASLKDVQTEEEIVQLCQDAFTEAMYDTYYSAHLDEDCNLDEDADEDEILFGLREECVSNVFSKLKDYLNRCNAVNLDNYPYLQKQTFVDDLESICEEAIYHIEDIMDDSGKLTEEVLDEKIPKDLARGYRGFNYKGAHGSMTDLENSTYDEVSKEDAYKLYKQDPRQIRLLLDGRFIDFNPDGRPSTEHRDQYLSSNRAFINRNGKMVRDTRYIPPRELIKLADKVYVANEVKKDTDLLDVRAQNPESPRSNVRLKTQGVGNRTRWGNEIRGNMSTNDQRWTDRRIKRDKDYLDSIKRQLQNPDLSQSRRDDLEREVDEYEKIIAKNSGAIKDAKARRRYAASEIALQKPLERYNELKNNLDSLQRTVDRSNKNLQDVRNSGSYESRRQKEKLADLQNRLLEIRKQIARVELDLEGADEEDAKAIAKAENEYYAAVADLGNARAEIDTLLRRN